MSFLTGLVGVAKSAFGFITGKSIGSQIARTVLTGLAIKKIASANQQESNTESSLNEEQPDFGVRLQQTADPSQKIPVVYGNAFTGGKLIDVRMTDNNQTMWYCLVLSERTGVKMSDSVQSVVTFKDIYYNNSRVVFKADGHTIDYTVDVNGKIDRSLNDLVEIYCFNNGSTNPTNVEDFATQTATAYSLMPSWTSTDTMNELVFVLCKVKYNKEKNTAGLGSVIAKLSNSMTLPGDCLNDMMTNTRYGASIPAGDINQS
jgi:hypothetical protein